MKRIRGERTGEEKTEAGDGSWLDTRVKDERVLIPLRHWVHSSFMLSDISLLFEKVNVR